MYIYAECTKTGSMVGGVAYIYIHIFCLFCFLSYFLLNMDNG